MDGLFGRGSWTIWHHGGLEHPSALDPGIWYSTAREEGCRFMAAWVKEEGKASEHRQRKRRTRLKLHIELFKEKSDHTYTF